MKTLKRFLLNREPTNFNRFFTFAYHNLESPRSFSIPKSISIILSYLLAGGCVHYGNLWFEKMFFHRERMKYYDRLSDNKSWKMAGV